MRNLLILASNSPRRKQLLKKINIDFDVIPSNLREEGNLDFNPIKFVEYWAKEKAIKVAKQRPNNLIFSADTVVSYKNKIFGKPKDKIDSFKMLKFLSGKTHKVITGIVFFHKGKNVFLSSYQETFVSITNLNNKQIEEYINTNNTLDKAGGYGIQGCFSIYIHNINGCFYNVMGLPLYLFNIDYQNALRLLK